jgi:putative transposase
MTTTIETLAQTIPVSQACAVLGFPRSSLYRSRQANVCLEKPPRLPSARALSDGERAVVRDLLESERFVDRSPYELYATLLDEGVYHCSVSTMYRILHAYAEVQERRNQRQHPAYAKPELLATGPNQVWSWDITKLRGPAKWHYYYLYTMLDIYSRYAVGWLLAEQESAALAQQLIEVSCEKQQIGAGQLTLHADRGAPMTAKAVTQLLDDLGVTKTHSRPYNSNDNPFSEAQFKTMKYRPDYPDRFGSKADAHTWAHAFFGWYNNEHHHIRLGLLTPATVHYGRAPQVIAQRQTTLAVAYRLHPERFVKGEPTPLPLPAAVWINPPKLGQDDLQPTPPTLAATDSG